MKSNHYHTKRMSVFKHWTNKSYAVFSSFGRVIKIAALSLSSLIVALPAQSQEKKDTSSVQKVIEFDDVEVTGESAPMIYSQQSRIVTVITKEEIQSAPAQNIQELLSYALNLDLRTRGGNDIQADISLRGGSFDQTLVLLNGINVSDPQTGHFALNLPIDLQSIERIEILNGPAARIFGANAFNGAINIITGTLQDNSVKLYGSYGEHQLFNTGFAANLVKGNLGTFVAANIKGSDGYTKNTDFKGHNVFYHGSLSLAKVNFNWQAGFNQKEFGALAFYSAKYPDQFEENDTKFASVKADFGKKVKISAATYFRQHSDHFVLFRANPEWYQNFHLNSTYGAKVRASTQWKLGKSSAGIELRTEEIISNNLGEKNSDSTAVPGFDGYYYTKGDRRNYVSAFIDHSVFYKKFAVSMGLMSQFIADQEAGFFPGIDASYQINSTYRVFASVNKSLRMPTFTDLYYSGPSNLGNVNLKPEESLTFETGLKMKFNALSGHLSYFNRYGTNIIDWIWHADTEMWETANITELNTSGIETAFDMRLDNVDLINGIQFSYAYLDIKKSSGEYETKYALDNLRHNVAVTIDHKVVKNLDAVWRFKYQDRNGSYQAYNIEEALYSTHDYKPLLMADVRLAWQLNALKLYVDVANLFDVEDLSYGSIPQPGRWFKFGGSYTFRKKN